MTKQEILSSLQVRGPYRPSASDGKRIKFDCTSSGDGVIMFDAAEHTITDQDGPADTVVSIALGDIGQMMMGNLGGDALFMRGRIAITGEVNNMEHLINWLQRR